LDACHVCSLQVSRGCRGGLRGAVLLLYMVVQYSPVQPGPETLLAFCFDRQRVLAGVVGRSRNLGRFLSVTDADHLPKNNWRLTELHRYHGILNEERAREYTERMCTSGEALRHSAPTKEGPSDLGVMGRPRAGSPAVCNIDVWYPPLTMGNRFVDGESDCDRIRPST
jgi:hypothetical protein